MKALVFVTNSFSVSVAMSTATATLPSNVSLVCREQSAYVCSCNEPAYIKDATHVMKVISALRNKATAAVKTAAGSLVFICFSSLFSCNYFSSASILSYVKTKEIRPSQTLIKDRICHISGG